MPRRDNVDHKTAKLKEEEKKIKPSLLKAIRREVARAIG
jgi:hypothetical protein